MAVRWNKFKVAEFIHDKMSGAKTIERFSETLNTGLIRKFGFLVQKTEKIQILEAFKT